MGRVDCKVLKHQRLTQDMFRATFESPEISGGSLPGQFVHLRVGSGIDPLLRRPFSIHRVDKERNCFDLLYRVVGCGTAMMSLYTEGDYCDMMGPLGVGFDLTGSFSRALVVAGGMGSAPAFFLMDELVSLGKEVAFLWGVRKKDEIFDIRLLEKQGISVHYATDDGSLGYKGLVTGLLEKYLKENPQDASTRGFVCGPEPMLMQVQKITEEYNVLWQASLEERMACGIGVCQGCGARMKEDGYRMVCSEGPVFDLQEVVFHA